MSSENSLRETTTRGMGREIEQRNIARALARDARYVHTRKAFSVLMRTAGDGPRWSHKSQNEAIRTCPSANMSGRVRLSVKLPSAVSTLDTYVYPHNKLPYVRGVTTLPVVYFNERYWRRGRNAGTTERWLPSNFQNRSKINGEFGTWRDK